MATRLTKIHGDAPSPARVPPHNLEAEESVLGSCLLSRQAIATAIESLAPDDFYKPAHAEMFRIMLDLYARGEPVDAVTMGEELRRQGNLDEFGGKPYLFTLVSSVPSPGSVGHYARIVSENATLRRLIDASQQINDLAYALPDDVEEAVDQSEDLIYQVTNRRLSEDLAALKDLLTENMEMVEKLYERGSSITGVATGFSDLDDLTAGLQPSNLIIVAARPSMGKALALDTPIATPSGWITMGEIHVGDEVFDERGRPCSVDSVSPVYTDHDCYEVCFDDGSVIVADAGHQWWMCSGARSPKIVTTAGMLAKGLEMGSGKARRPRWHLAAADPLDMPEAVLPIDPYVLGCWLGGGHTTSGAMGKRDRAHFSWEFQRAGYCLKNPVVVPWSAGMHIPAPYLRASFKQRLALLQGLMDTAGKLKGGAWVELCLTNRRLVAQARELACSLGHKPGPMRKRSVRLRGGGTAKAWQLRWRSLDPVFRLERKADRLQAELSATAPDPSTTRRSVVAIRPVPPVPVRCIQVGSPGHLYLAGESMIPTHNSALALSIAQHVATNDQRPVVIFSLEMSKMELVQRLMCSEARVDSNRLRRGALQDADWPKLSLALGRLAEAPIFIDDTPNATIMEMRAKCRRVASKTGLGLVIIDYLQLMAPLRRTDNRVQEVSEISRSLKILARELEVPVIALSQLSRNVEYRADKRPLLADLRESGCLTASTRILRADTGAEVTLGELMASGEKPLVWSLDPELKMVARRIENVFLSGIKDVFRVRLTSGRSVDATTNHPFLTLEGWMPLGELLPGSRVATPGRVPEPLQTQRLSNAEVKRLARERSVPAEVFALPNDQLALFLRQLWAVDGCVWWDDATGTARIYCTSKSRQLIDNLSMLLLRFDIPATSEAAGEAGWQLHISGTTNQLRFVERVCVHGLGGMPARAVAARLRSAASTYRATVHTRIWGAGTVLVKPRLHSRSVGEVFWDEIAEVTSLGPQAVYDATVSDTHNFVANGIQVHNSIEQDADVVMFIYRDEVYHPDSPQRGIAEIHISKHRSGPIGKVELTFLEHYTKFANLARGM